MSKPAAILFDFGGTLDCPSHWLDRFLAHYRAAGFEITREELDPAFDFATKTGYAAGKTIERFKLGDLVRFLVGNQFEFLRGEGPVRIRESLIAMNSNALFKSVERIRESFLRETVAGLARSREILRDLKPNFKLAVISNWYGNLDAIIAEAGMDRLFDGVIDSSKVRSFKPEPGIFQAALKALGTRADETAMVGDSLGKDLIPAHRIGMRTVFMRSAGSELRSVQSSDDTEGDFTADFVINSLREITELRW